MTPFKLTGLIVGIAFIFLAVCWRDNPDASAILIFFAGTMLVLGPRHNIVNEEDTEWKN